MKSGLSVKPTNTNLDKLRKLCTGEKKVRNGSSDNTMNKQSDYVKDKNKHKPTRGLTVSWGYFHYRL